MVKDLPDLYTLDPAALRDLLGVATGRAVHQAIMEANEPPLHQFLDALGIDGLGTTTSKAVAGKFLTLAAVRAATQADFMALEGVGPLSAGKIVNGLRTMGPTIDALTRLIDVQEIEVVTGALTGLSFCLTGAMSRQRSAIEKDIEAHGGTIKSCGKGLSFLVQADPGSTSSKSVKAKSLGIPVISEKELEDMMAHGARAVRG